MSQVAQVTPLPKRETWTKSGPVVSRSPQDEIEVLEERATATIADPTPLGLWGFATGTWITGTVIAGMFPRTALTATIPVLLIFAGLTQFIAGLFAFRRANVLSATAFCSFGAFNVLTALLSAMQAIGKLTNSVASGTFVTIGNIGGWVLVASAFFAYYTGMALVVNSSWNSTVFPVGGEA